MTGETLGIIGAGKMGEAIVSGLIKTGMIAKNEILISDIDDNRKAYITKKYGIRTTSDNSQVAVESGILILCVRPGDVKHILAEIRDSLTTDKLIISVVAGVTMKFILDTLERRVSLVRAMPNSPCTIGEGMTVLTSSEGTSESHLDRAKNIFGALGRTLFLGEELFDAVTGLSASGPAYVYLFIEALAEGGLKMGIPMNDALLLAAQTVLGSARMVLETGEHPARLKDMVATPGGTTVCGLYELEKAGIRAALVRTVESATIRAKELSS